MVAPRRLTAVFALSAFALASCSSGGGTKKASGIGDVSSKSFHSCTTVACTGTLDGAAYKIEMPATWNGTLLLWSHGYRSAVKAPPDYTVDRSAEDGPAGVTNADLLKQGYALAGSAFASNGWDVQDGVRADTELHDYFVKSIGTPRRTYVWGASLGGLITELVSEQNPTWVSGAAPECGAVAGTTENLDGALAIAYMVKTLIDPTLKITNYTSSAEAIATFLKAEKDVTTAAQDVAGGGTAKVVAIAAIGDLATQTKSFDGADPVSQISAKAEDIITDLAFATYGQQEFAERVGGQGLDITTTDFAAGLSADDRSAITAFGGNADAILAALKAGSRPAVDPAARQKALAQGETTGKVTHPTVTLHDEQDPLVVPQNERVLGDRFYANGDSPHLTQLFTKPPATYTSAPYGAGHCNFTNTEELGLIATLDHWVLTGTRATPAYAATVFKQPTGLDLSYYPQPFPLRKAS